MHRAYADWILAAESSRGPSAPAMAVPSWSAGTRAALAGDPPSVPDAPVPPLLAMPTAGREGSALDGDRRVDAAAASPRAPKSNGARAHTCASTVAVPGPNVPAVAMTFAPHIPSPSQQATWAENSPLTVVPPTVCRTRRKMSMTRSWLHIRVPMRPTELPVRDFAATLPALAWNARAEEHAAFARGRTAMALRSAIDRAAPGSVDDRVALLAQELADVVHRQPGLPRRARALPTAERLHARPRARRRARAAVDVQDAGLDPVEERAGPRPGPRCRCRRSARRRVVGERAAPRRASRPPRPR